MIPPPENVFSVPGFVSSMFQIQVQVPATTQSLQGIGVGNGVTRASIGLQFEIAITDVIPPVSNIVGVYVK